MTDKVVPYSLKDAPSLIEKLLPVQKISVESYKEQMSNTGKILTALGTYWKGRKPLILNRACIIGSLIPSTKDSHKDLRVFELLMGMDEYSLRKRLALKDDEVIPSNSYKELALTAKRADELDEGYNTHIWEEVNEHLGTNAFNYPDLVNQLGIMRFGHRPRVADTFSGSGQIPYEAARLGADVFASDLNPIACMLTWGSFFFVGADAQHRSAIDEDLESLIKVVQKEIDDLGLETDGNGWRGKYYLYCLEILCPLSGWKVPVLPSLIISQDKKIIAKLIPNKELKRYEIELAYDVSNQELLDAKKGTYSDQSVVHSLNGVEYKTKISSLRGDFFDVISGEKISKNKLRHWDDSDIEFSENDIYSERLYAILWIKDDDSDRSDAEFRSVTEADLEREKLVANYVKSNLREWQSKGFLPNMKIEPGYNTSQPIWERGWTYWHHLFNPRQLLVNGLLNQTSNPAIKLLIAQLINYNAKLSIWHSAKGQGFGSISQVFYNQALNTIYNYGCRGSSSAFERICKPVKNVPVDKSIVATIKNSSAQDLKDISDIYITDPPYGDAVKYEEIYEFFISWFRTNTPKEFSSWVWDSRRALAIKGEDHDFKLSMVDAYKRMTECMPDNGIQVVMFTHQSGSIWADMANIVWAAGLKVSAAWYIVTETDSALRDGQYVKGTILLVLKKRNEQLSSFRDELAYELKEEVENQVELLTGLNSDIKELCKNENLFEDADIQMAGYAAALRVLTKYSVIDGVDMPKEALRPRVKGQATLVDDLIEFAVNIANQYLVPEGLNKEIWDELQGSERFYLKMLDMESREIYSLSNYQNFAKAFKVDDFSSLIGDTKANKTQLKTAEVFGKKGMSGSDEFGATNVRSILYAIFLLIENKMSSDDVLHQLKELVHDFYRKRNLLIAIADYINKKTSGIREIESQSARVLRDLIRNERV